MNATKELERPSPQAIESERVLLGVFLSDPQKHAQLLEDLNEKDFFLPEHRTIFAALRALWNRGNGCDLLLLDDELRRAGKLEAAGGTAYVADLLQLTPPGLNIAANLRLLRDSAIRRRLLHIFENLKEELYGNGNTAGELLDRAGEQIGDLAREVVEAADSGVTWREAATQLLASLEERSGIRVFTGIQKLDRSTGGFRAGELVVVCAETGVGKTLFSQQIRRRACLDGHHALFASGEMSADQLTARELACEAEVAAWKLRQPERINREELSRLVTAAAHECPTCRVLDGELTIRRIRQAARRMKKNQGGLGLVLIDYDELVESDGENEFERQQTLARSSKSMAVELSAPVILVSQLRKPVSGEDAARPTLARLYGSAAKTKHASAVVYIDRPFVRELQGDQIAANLFLLKNRFGPAGRIPARFNLQSLRFEDGDPETAKESQSDLWRNPAIPRDSDE